MVRNNSTKPHKVTLARWINTTLDKSLSKNNIRFGFKVTWIWPLNTKAMDENFGLIEVYTIEPTNMEEVEQSNSKSKGEENQQWAEKLIVEKLLNITTIVEITNITIKVDIL